MVTISKAERHQSRPKVTCEVDRITCFPTEASTDTKDDEEQSQRYKVARPNVPIILQSVYAEVRRVSIMLNEDGRWSNYS